MVWLKNRDESLTLEDSFFRCFSGINVDVIVEIIINYNTK